MSEPSDGDISPMLLALLRDLQDFRVEAETCFDRITARLDRAEDEMEAAGEGPDDAKTALSRSRKPASP